MTQLVSSDQLRARVDLSYLNFTTTADLEGASGFLGQPRAKEALEFGINMQATGYNLYVMGETGTGRQSLVSSYVREVANRRTPPNDLCYINNFERTRDPFVLQLPAGKGKVFKEDMEAFVDELLSTFPDAFENPSYQRRRASIDREFNQKYDQAIMMVDRQASQQEVALMSDQGSIILAPIVEGKVLDETEFAQLPEGARTEFQRRIQDLEEVLNEALLELPQWRRETSEKQRSLDEETINQAVKPLLRELEHKYDGDLSVLRYLRQLKKQMPRIIGDIFLEDLPLERVTDIDRKHLLNGQLLPNLMVQNDPATGVPVVYELLPTYQNLFGRIEYATQQGMSITNFQLIQPGSLHKANGGYLILDAEKLLMEPFAWDALKLALKTRQIKMESPFVDPSLMHAVTLSPEVVPLQVKIILIGSRDIYYQLLALDPEFNELFRILVDFDSYIPRDNQSVEQLILRIKHYAEEKGYQPIHRDAVARLIEFSLRQGEHQQRISAQIIHLFKMVAEADYLRQEMGDEIIEAQHVDRALQAAEYRSGRISDQMILEIAEGTIKIATHGERVGCVNGLTVMEIGESIFGSPARITATASLGSQGIMDIEREAELGQAVHSKGVMILNGYLAQQYGREFPLTLNAHIAMEQSYGHVDGDSATCAELVALISAVSRLPVKQSLAVTGSMNQHGEVQAVGGINEKIEGFFKVCASRGLTGEQGVIIPADNIRHLMLNDEVIQAVEKGQFNIYSAEGIDDVLSRLLALEPAKIHDQTKVALREMYDAMNDDEEPGDKK
ncbi:Lon protease family protein [Salinispirillum marinum]|uniref:endopeptidase La n=2 Tax=Saccharospirillaceae TaxID=255527 RepID=A0ABV8BBG4_9GAMM